MLGMVLVRSLLICTSGLGGGGLRVTCSACRGLAGHLLCVSGAGGSLALRDGGRRSTGSACRGPAVHWLGVSRACGPLARAVAGRRATQTPLWRGRQEWKFGLGGPCKTPLWRGRQERLVFFHSIKININSIK